MLVACATPGTGPATTGPGPGATVPAAAMPVPAADGAPGKAATFPAAPIEGPDDDVAMLPPVLVQARSRWVPVRWAELPGFSDDALHEAWNAWLKSCERPGPAFAALCPEVRVLSLAPAQEQRRWMMQRLQPYRVEPLSGGAGDGLLTAYYEPVLQASRTQQDGFEVPLYRPPARLATRKPWYTRKEMETLPEAKAALRGQEIAWLADPVDALVLQIQGSGRLQLREPDGRQHMVRLAYAATNDQPYGSVGRWLLDQRQLRNASWPSIRNWVALNPQRVNEMLWSNPRTVFFREEPLSEFDASFGPRGAQGVPLTPGRSIAVDPGSIPYGTPVWLASGGPVLNLKRLVLAQDTGGAIVGAVRADYFVGWGSPAGDIAGRLKQPLQLWTLWPKP
jgi:membrane-bound lytic murein transglycosylase A